MGASLSNEKLVWASSENIQSLPSKSQIIQIYGMNDDQGIEKVINDLVVLDCFGIQTNSSGNTTFQNGMINPVLYEDRLVINTSISLKSNCNSWADVQVFLLESKKAAQEASTSGVARAPKPAAGATAPAASTKPKQGSKDGK